MQIRALELGDDRQGFCSGNREYDAFLQQYAAQNQFRYHIGVTYVCVEDGPVLGYATVVAGSIEVDDLPVGLRDRLPRYPLPILRLARLAVDQRAQHQGIGPALVRFVCQLALDMQHSVGCVGLLVDSLAERVSFYEGLGFMRMEVVSGRSETRPLPIPMLLPARDIEAAVGTP